MILSKAVSIEIADWLSVLFPYPGEYDFGFSGLHEAVLDIGTRSVIDEIARLTLVTGTLNDQDLQGYTSLAWAAARDDVQTTKVLLQHGADPNIQDVLGRTPIFHNVTTRECKCVNLLLQHGADPNIIDGRGRSILYTLIRSLHGQSFRQTAGLLDFHHMDLDLRDITGMPILFQAIQRKNHEAVCWLLAHNAEYTVYHVGTFLHFVAWYATMEMIEIVRKARIMGIDIHALDSHDEPKTAMEMLLHPMRLPPASSEMIEEFTLLLDEIEERTIAQSVTEQPIDGHRGSISSASTLNGPEDEVELEVFVDAVEEQRVDEQ